MMIVLSPILTAITFAMLAVMLLVVKTIGGRSRRYFAAQQKAIGAVNGYIEEMIEGQKVIKVFNHEDAAKAGFAGLNETYRDAATRAQAYAGAMMPAMGKPEPHQLCYHLLHRRPAGHPHRRSGRALRLFAVYQAGEPAHHPDLSAGEHHPLRCGRRRAGL